MLGREALNQGHAVAAHLGLESVAEPFGHRRLNDGLVNSLPEDFRRGLQLFGNIQPLEQVAFFKVRLVQLDGFF